MPADQAVTEHAATDHTVTGHAPDVSPAATNGRTVIDADANQGTTNGHRVPVPGAGTVDDGTAADGTAVADDTAGSPATRGPAGGTLSTAWSAVVHDVRALTQELADAGIGVARQLSRPAVTIRSLPSVPTIPALQAGLTRVEDALAREVKTRLERVEDVPGHPHATRDSGWLSAGELLGDLLAASRDTDTATAREELYRSLLLRLVPDEAKLLATLADGRAHPVVHVQTKSRTVLGHVSTLDEVAGLALPEASGPYLAHLITLGLVEEGPEDERLADGYQRLLGRTRVRNAEEVAREDGRLGNRLARRTVRISRLGAELWLNCHNPAVDAAA